ncbi:hypothetical protein SDC9_110105 [bioreactor metagenome]|uniref:Uncharacterized protein n=1 Tax=bioreactor metagenome TaxID=1076179 RepID=A0A645BCP5_9ZZZZ
MVHFFPRNFRNVYQTLNITNAIFVLFIFYRNFYRDKKSKMHHSGNYTFVNFTFFNTLNCQILLGQFLGFTDVTFRENQTILLSINFNDFDLKILTFKLSNFAHVFSAKLTGRHKTSNSINHHNQATTVHFYSLGIKNFFFFQSFFKVLPFCIRGSTLQRKHHLAFVIIS